MLNFFPNQKPSMFPTFNATVIIFPRKEFSGKREQQKEQKNCPRNPQHCFAFCILINHLKQLKTK